MKVREVAPVYQKKSLHAAKNDAAYWRTYPYTERIATLEMLRQEYHEKVSLVELFADVDDFCQIFEPRWEHFQRTNGLRQRK